MDARDFYLGVHHGRMIEDPRTAGVPLMVSAHVLAAYRSRGDALPHRAGPWMADSGGFTELRDHGHWRLDADEFGGLAYRMCDEFGWPPDWFPVQDWMCEDYVINGGWKHGKRFVGTGLTMADHHELTVDSYAWCLENFPAVRWMPVLQGKAEADYRAHARMYRAAGFDLTAVPRVGLGSVCGREATREIEVLVRTLADDGLTLHGFGIKTPGLARYGRYLASADSQAWSLVARYEHYRLPQPDDPDDPDRCTHPGDCRNCLRWALVWRRRVLDRLAEGLALPEQLDLFTPGACA